MAKWALVQVKTHDDGRPSMELEIGGYRLKHGDFYQESGDTDVNQYDYVSCEKEHGRFEYAIVAHRFDGHTRVKITDSYGNRMGGMNLHDKTSGDGLNLLPTFKEREPEAEEAEALWKKTSVEVKAKYKAKSAPCEWNEDGTPDFGMMACGNGSDGLREELTTMKCDYTGEYFSHPKFPREEFVGFKTEEDAIEAYMEDHNWIISKWDGKAWRELKVKREKGSKKMEVVWK